MYKQLKIGPKITRNMTQVRVNEFAGTIRSNSKVLDKYKYAN